MESLAAVSLACNVVQLVQFSLETARVFKNLAENKCPAELIDRHRKRLEQLIEQVINSRPAGNTTASITTTASSNPIGGPNLDSFTDSLLVASKELEAAVAKYEPQKSKIKNFVKAIRFQWSGKRKVEELHGSLKNMENTLQTSILFDTRYETTLAKYQPMLLLIPTRQRASNFNAEILASLDSQLLGFVRQLQAGITDLKTLVEAQHEKTRTVVTNEGEATRDRIDVRYEDSRNDLAKAEKNLKGHVDGGFDALRKNQQQSEDNMLVQTLLDSLSFGQQNARYNAIVPSHEGTFEWIFNHERTDSNSASSMKYVKSGALLKWLRSDDTLFWIQGKPGAGKSTLMRFLASHDKTRAILQKNGKGSLILSASI